MYLSELFFIIFLKILIINYLSKPIIQLIGLLDSKTIFSMKKIILLLLILRGAISVDAQCISGNCDNGTGTAIIQKKGGIRFSGQFLNRKPHGQGTAEYPDGTRYEGAWLNGTMEGIGTLVLNDGTVLSGVWRNSRFLGNDPALSREDILATANSSHENIKIINPPQYRISEDGFTSTPTPIKIAEMPLENVVGRADAFVENADLHTQASNMQIVNSAGNNSLPPISKVWALAVGVSNYDMPNILTLKYPHSDAFRMYAFWKSPEGGSLDDKHSQVLVNDQATKKGIIDSMRQMFMQASEHDLVTFFYSGHGLKGAFLPTDYDGSSLRLFHSEVNDLMGACPAKYKLVIADACNSGSYLASKSGSNDVFKSSQQDIQDAFFRELNRSSPGTAFILSSQADEESLEVSTLHQSIFSYFVLRGMKGEANANGDEVVTVQELFDFVYRQVTAYALSLGKIQTPVIKGNYDPNMPVAMVRKN